MRDERRNYLVVGLFVIGMGAALAIWLVLMAGQGGPSERYVIVYRNVMGLEPGVQILYEGYAVGFIEAIKPIRRDGLSAYRVEVSVAREFEIPADSVAAITAPGVLAAVVIDIRSGTSSERLAPGDEIRGREAVDIFAAMNDVASEIVELLETSIRPLIVEVSKGTPDIIANVDHLTEELNNAVEQINALFAQGNVRRVSRILENVETATGDFNGMIDELREVRRDVSALMARTNALFDEETGALGGAIADLNHSLGAVARHIDSIAANLDTTTRNMNEFSQRVRDNPGVLIRGRDEGEEP